MISKKEKEFKHFCDNPNCPNHELELNDENHHHDGIGSICGILKTHQHTSIKIIHKSNAGLSVNNYKLIITN